MTREVVAALGAFFDNQAQRKSLTLVARNAGVLLGACLLFASCQASLLSDDATFADAGEADAGAPDAGTDSAGCQGCQIAGQCVPTGGHNVDNWCEVCAPQQSAGTWSDACAETEVCDGPAQRCDACEADRCLIDGACWPDRATKRGNACLVCDPARDRLGWSWNSGAECDDGDFCTVLDRCQGNTCVGGKSRDCSDGLTCTEDSCNPATARCEATVMANNCAIGGTCVTRSQVNPDQICQVCDPDTNSRAYRARERTACDDGLTCTETDACGPSGVCAGTPVATGSRCPGGYCDESGRCGGDLVAAGASHSCVLRAGTLYCFGGNQYGQLGDATTAHRHRAVRVGADNDWSQVVAGDAHTCGRRGGAIYCWGDDQHGQLGNGKGNEPWFSTPQRVGTGEDWGALAAGGDHTCAIRQGALYCWGRNTQGQLGDGTTENRHAPTRVGTDMDWSAVIAGFQHTCGLRGNDLYCWGYNASKQLGDRTTADRRQPVPIGLPGAWSRICAGDNHTCGLRSGVLYCWGSNAYGKLGLTNTDEAPEPAEVPGPTWQTIVCGGDHTCATQSGGDLFCWGRNDRGQLGDGTMADSATPLSVSATWTGLSIGRYHTCGLQGAVFRCWGANDSGQLGDGTTTDQAGPVDVSGL